MATGTGACRRIKRVPAFLRRYPCSDPSYRNQSRIPRDAHALATGQGLCIALRLRARGQQRTQHAAGDLETRRPPSQSHDIERSKPSASLAGGRNRGFALEEDFELDQLTTAGASRDSASQESQARRDDKRREKLERLLREAEEMKFSHSIQFNAVPDWSNHYIAYSNLKKL